MPGGYFLEQDQKKMSRGKYLYRLNYCDEFDDEDDLNSRAYRLRRRKRMTSCSRCPIHNVENRRRQERPTKYKDKRKGKLYRNRKGAQFCLEVVANVEKYMM